MRAATTMMHALQQFPLTHWNGPPMVLIRPRCGEDWLSFGNIGATIQEGHRAAHKALEDIDAFYDQPGGVYPRRRFEIEVDQDKCIGCGLCVSLAPNLMGLDAAGKAYTRTRTADWSPAMATSFNTVRRAQSSRARSSGSSAEGWREGRGVAGQWSSS
jgi:NTE family protein